MTFFLHDNPLLSLKSLMSAKKCAFGTLRTQSDHRSMMTSAAGTATKPPRLADRALRAPLCRWRALILTLLLCGYFPAANAYDPLEFVPKHVPAARLNGSSLVRRYGKPVYIVKLFVDQSDYAKQTYSPQDLSHESFALDVEYLQPITGADITRELHSQMKDMGLAPKSQINAWTTSLRRFLPDLQTHDHLTAVYQPGQGTHFYRNGNALSDIGGNDFAQAFFGIWLDATSTDPGARARLLHSTQ